MSKKLNLVLSDKSKLIINTIKAAKKGLTMLETAIAISKELENPNLPSDLTAAFNSLKLKKLLVIKGERFNPLLAGKRQSRKACIYIAKK